MTASQFNFEKLKDDLENRILTNIYPPPTTTKCIRSRCKKSRELRFQNAFQAAFKTKVFHGTYENIVNSSDGRKQVHATEKWPHSVNGAIEWEFGDEPCQGTGILIGPNIVLTAAHNLYNFAKKTYAKLESLRFKPGVNGKLLPFGEVKVENYLVPDDYINREKEDFGILILKEPIGDMTGYFGLACLNPAELAKKRIKIAGYPKDKVKSKPGTYEMWEMEGSIDKIDEEHGSIYHNIDTSGGQSGSGLVYKEYGEYFVCGVHAQGGETVNMATLLTKRRYTQIYRWIQNNVKTELLFYLNTECLRFEEQKIDTKFTSLLLRYDLSDLRVLSCPWGSFEKYGARELAQNTSWINLRELNLVAENINDEVAKAFAQNTSWINLQELNLSLNKISDEGAKALAQNTSWINLRQLNLLKNNIGDEGAKALAQNTSWINLRELNLFANNIGKKGARALAENTSWINLRELKLPLNKINDEGAKALAQNISWVNLQQLSLSGNNIGVDGANALAKNKSWINLSRLILFENKIGNEGAKAIGQNTSWINLSRLDLALNNIGDEGVRGLVQNISWIDLRQLDLDENNIGDEGAKALAQNTSWINLSKLNLFKNHIGCEGARGLAKNSSWTCLSDLNLSENNIGDEGAKALSQNTAWIYLQKLDLSKNNIGDEGARGLAKNSSWMSLSILTLSYNNIYDKGAKALAQNTSWEDLSQLNLNWNSIAKEAYAFLQNSSWRRLSTLRLEGNQIDDNEADSLARIEHLDLAWNPLSYEFAQYLSKKSHFSKVLEFDFENEGVGQRTPSTTRSQVFLIWGTLENSKTLDPLRMIFISKYRSFVMKITPPKYFEGFIIDISHFMHSRLDLNFPPANTEEENESFGGADFNSDSYVPILYGNQLSIEEGNTLAQNDSNLNFNSNKFSVEEFLPSFQNTYQNSS